MSIASTTKKEKDEARRALRQAAPQMVTLLRAMLATHHGDRREGLCKGACHEARELADQLELLGFV